MSTATSRMTCKSTFIITAQSYCGHSIQCKVIVVILYSAKLGWPYKRHRNVPSGDFQRFRIFQFILTAGYHAPYIPHRALCI